MIWLSARADGARPRSGFIVQCRHNRFVHFPYRAKGSLSPCAFDTLAILLPRAAGAGSEAGPMMATLRRPRSPARTPNNKQKKNKIKLRCTLFQRVPKGWSRACNHDCLHNEMKKKKFINKRLDFSFLFFPIRLSNGTAIIRKDNGPEKNFTRRCLLVESLCVTVF